MPHPLPRPTISAREALPCVVASPAWPACQGHLHLGGLPRTLACSPRGHFLGWFLAAYVSLVRTAAQQSHTPIFWGEDVLTTEAAHYPLYVRIAATLPFWEQFQALVAQTEEAHDGDT